MSKVKIQGNASGTGVLTIEAPNTNTDRTISLPDSTGTLVDTTGATFTGGVTGTDVTLSGGVYVGGTGSANYLDDYEEGTWTPSFAASGGTLSVSYHEQVGAYTKVGNVVTVTAWLRTSSVSGGGNYHLYVSGLPFTVESGHTKKGGAGIGQLQYWLANKSPTSALGKSGDTQLYMWNRETNSGYGDTVKSQDLRTTSDSNQISFTYTYLVS